MPTEIVQLPVIGENQGRIEFQGSGRFLKLRCNDSRYSSVSSSMTGYDSLARSAELVLSSERPKGGIYTVNILITSRSVIDILRILSGFLCDRKECVTGIVVISEISGTVETRLNLESTLVVLLSLIEFLQGECDERPSCERDNREIKVPVTAQL